MPARMKLSSVYSTLPPAERKVADYILAYPDEAAHMVINEIARKAGVSVPSVTRLARKLGYNGFMDFRVSLASGSSSVVSSSTLPIRSDDSDEQLINKLMIGHIAAIESTLRVLDAPKLSRLPNIIMQANRIVWFGLGASMKLASIYSEQLCRLGLDSVICCERPIMHNYAKCLQHGDIAIAISRTGKTQRTLDALRTAKEAGATTVFITNLVNSSGENHADYFICTSRQDELYRICGYETCTSMCALFETLMTLIVKKKGFESKSQFLETIAYNR